VLPDPDLKAVASLPPAADEPSKAVDSGESIAAKAKSIPTTSAPRRRPSASACSAGKRAPNPRNVSPRPSTSRPRRSRARPDRGGAGGDEPHFLRLLSSTVCGVVYQNKHGRPFECQFTFACDNIPDVVTEPTCGIAPKDRQGHAGRRTLAAGSGQVDALPCLLGAPSWVNEMKRCTNSGCTPSTGARLGRRQRRAELGTPAQTAEISAELSQEARSSAELSPNSVRR